MQEQCQERRGKFKIIFYIYNISYTNYVGIVLYRPKQKKKKTNNLNANYNISKIILIHDIFLLLQQDYSLEINTIEQSWMYFWTYTIIHDLKWIIPQIVKYTNPNQYATVRRV